MVIEFDMSFRYRKQKGKEKKAFSTAQTIQLPIALLDSYFFPSLNIEDEMDSNLCANRCVCA